MILDRQIAVLERDRRAAMVRLFEILPDGELVVLARYDMNDVAAVDIGRYRAALVRLLEPATDRERRLLADCQRWIDDHDPVDESGEQ